MVYFFHGATAAVLAHGLVKERTVPPADIERAIDEEGEELDVHNLADLHFQGPAELVPRFNAGDRVQIVTSPESSLQISSIRPAPLS